ncbi:hypothetical protein [Amycolatopsis sp.]|uniref:hypothetical protein n=1 Tax=Amycolatopsis sp. TaxID=37632 RepID=UPI00261CF60F|nr:hypothetical protein [Amycolatopsis sp.]
MDTATRRRDAEGSFTAPPRRDRSIRHDIEFDAEGATLRGWFYEAEGTDGPAPCVVMAHGWSATRRLYLDRFAEVFSAAGMWWASISLRPPRATGSANTSSAPGTDEAAPEARLDNRHWRAQPDSGERPMDHRRSGMSAPVSSAQ